MSSISPAPIADYYFSSRGASTSLDVTIGAFPVVFDPEECRPRPQPKANPYASSDDIPQPEYVVSTWSCRGGDSPVVHSEPYTYGKHTPLIATGSSPSSSCSSSTPSETGQLTNLDDDRPPRPPNAFILFRNAFAAKSKVSTAPKVPGNPSKHAAIAWKALPISERRVWERLAEVEREKHSIKYPGFKYSLNQTARSGAQDGMLSSSINTPSRPSALVGPSLVPSTSTSAVSVIPTPFLSRTDTIQPSVKLPLHVTENRETDFKFDPHPFQPFPSAVSSTRPLTFAAPTPTYHASSFMIPESCEVDTKGNAYTMLNCQRTPAVTESPLHPETPDDQHPPACSAEAYHRWGSYWDSGLPDKYDHTPLHPQSNQMVASTKNDWATFHDLSETGHLMDMIHCPNLHPRLPQHWVDPLYPSESLGFSGCLSSNSSTISRFSDTVQSSPSCTSSSGEGPASLKPLTSLLHQYPGSLQSDASLIYDYHSREAAPGYFFGEMDISFASASPDTNFPVMELDPDIFAAIGVDIETHALSSFSLQYPPFGSIVSTEYSCFHVT